MNTKARICAIDADKALKYSFLLLSAIALVFSLSACASDQDADCRSFAFVPHGSYTASSNICPNARVYTYNQNIFHEQAVMERGVYAPKSDEEGDDSNSSTASNNSNSGNKNGRKS